MNKISAHQLDYQGKIVLIRTDYNLPLANGKITSDARLRASLPVIKTALDGGARRIVIISHMGRPAGLDKKLSLKPVIKLLEKYLQRPVQFVDKWREVASLDELLKKNKSTDSEIDQNRIVLLENLRFDQGEANNDRRFAEDLVRIINADLFVQDGFAVAHRRTATTDVITKLLPSYASDNFCREYAMITSFLRHAPRPCVAIVGGAKVSDKIDFLRKIAEKVDYLVIGGAMAHAFLAHRGVKLGKSLLEANQDATVEEIYRVWVQLNKPASRIILPIDAEVGAKLTQKTSHQRLINQIGEREMIGDLGKKSIDQIIKLIEQAGSILWNGNLGYTENPIFAHASKEVFTALCRYRPKTLIGGGDTVGFVEKNTTAVDFPELFLSTGGGATLELLAYNTLPGAEGLLNI
ncbi:MAG: phosphoglycerate kinase [Candidatus Saccharibacteria bacterium]|nr:phosphoglycerate kinase [Candidatus Saccharibacteria bacterium]